MRYQYQIKPQLSGIHKDKEIPILIVPRDVRLFLVIGQRFSGKSTLCQQASQAYQIEMINDGTHREYGVFSCIVGVAKRAMIGESCLPVVLIDGLNKIDGIKDAYYFFQPRLKIIESVASLKVRLERAQTLEPRLWDEKKLKGKDGEYLDFKNRLIDQLEFSRGRLVRISTDKGIRNCFKQLEEKCSFKRRG